PFIHCDADEAVSVEQYIARKATVVLPSMRVLPGHFACRTVESIDVTDLSAVGRNEDSVLRRDRVSVEFSGISICRDVIERDRLATGAIEFGEYAGASADVDDITHDRGRGEYSSSSLVLPQNLCGLLRQRFSGNEQRQSECDEHDCFRRLRGKCLSFNMRTKRQSAIGYLPAR